MAPLQPTLTSAEGLVAEPAAARVPTAILPHLLVTWLTASQTQRSRPGPVCVVHKVQLGNPFSLTCRTTHVFAALCTKSEQSSVRSITCCRFFMETLFKRHPCCFSCSHIWDTTFQDITQERENEAVEILTTNFQLSVPLQWLGKTSREATGHKQQQRRECHGAHHLMPSLCEKNSLRTGQRQQTDHCRTSETTKYFLP